MNRTKRVKGGDAKLIRHLEKHLGRMDGGWPMRSAGEALFIVKFIDRPVKGAVTFTTLGLSETVLHQDHGGHIRQELVFTTWATEDADEAIVSLVMVVVAEILETGHALDRGQVLGPAGPILDDVKAAALYCTFPGYFPREFWSIEDLDLYFVWLVPLMKTEATFARKHGWSDFEALFVQQDPDLLDLNRKPLCLR